MAPTIRPGFADARRLTQAGWLLGLSLGGFFDGILLHQILQWHHLLSAVTRAPFGDLRMQVLADGVFHAAMYAVAIAGLVRLWQAVPGLVMPGARRRLLGSVLLGFGAWHIADAVLSHWWLGLHRVRMDSEVPLFWDLLWFAVFGLVVTGWGVWLRRHPGGGNVPPRSGALLCTVLVLVCGAIAALPPPDARMVLVMFRPGAGAAGALAAIEAADARIAWASRDGMVWALQLPAPGQHAVLYRHGAMLVSYSLLPNGCFAWSRR
ncbi:DUF2243 domain-containing protein [Chitiniphilus purpureus]|uniref:DUF2243 domain-containing protein n=1 Tax=Chitiniphilus purpureus TaxID=2981137 RepID=A0ABY6DJQ6_9NEIS|nr:DUF2243 domain-containing protein [Chitiniphilus sp. CD1]UXY14267.1 DUF2243 domain-containing protein [Chitiniphilus sp. CD1]